MVERRCCLGLASRMLRPTEKEQPFEETSPRLNTLLSSLPSASDGCHHSV